MPFLCDRNQHRVVLEALAFIEVNSVDHALLGERMTLSSFMLSITIRAVPAVTASPGITDVLTTTPGIGARAMR